MHGMYVRMRPFVTPIQRFSLTIVCWQIHARLGEMLYTVGTANDENGATVVQSMRRFCRSVELCDDYIRGYYGLKLVRSCSHHRTTYCCDLPKDCPLGVGLSTIPCK